MRDIELYQRILGLEEPWRVESVRAENGTGALVLESLGKQRRRTSM